jgi:uncharacterized protein (TIGR02145 family)
MKKFTIIIVFVITIVNTQAQDYLISFAGTGATTSVGTVKVDNLTSGTTVTLNGGDILHLKAALGIESPDLNNYIFQIYPNPMVGQSLITFVAPENGDVDISLVDMYGRTVYQINKVLSPGANSFRISGVRQGMYSVKVSGHSYSYSAKLISQSNSQRAMGIEYVSSNKNVLSSRLKNSSSTIDMNYTIGDQLLFKGISGPYSTIVPDVPVSSKTLTFEFVACTDADNNNYSTVHIDTQTWMAENLNVGTRINGSVDQTQNSIIEKYCTNDDDANCAVYGGLYQWDEMMQYVNTPGVQGICPAGWHLPTNAEWITLTTFLGGDSIAGGKMKETTGTHWLSPNTGATNSSGFTALPAGDREDSNYFTTTGYYSFFWSSSLYFSSSAWSRVMEYYDAEIYRAYGSFFTFGYSVRCIQN